MAGLIDLNGLGHFKAKENAMVADTYSASKTYAVGDYVYYNGTLYRCTTAISTTEAWTAGHWTAVKLADDCSALKTALNNVVSNDFRPINYDISMMLANNGVRIAAGGATEASSAYSTSDYLPCSEGDVLEYSLATYSGKLILATYSTNTSTSAINKVTGTGMTIINGTYTFTANDKFFRISGYTAHVDKYSIKYNSYPINLKNRLTGIETNIGENYAEIFRPLMYSKDSMTNQDVRLDNNGYLESATDYATSDFLPCKSGDTIKYKLSTYTGKAVLATYTYNQQTYVKRRIIGGADTYTEGELTFEDGENYFRISSYSLPYRKENYYVQYNSIPSQLSILLNEKENKIPENTVNVAYVNDSITASQDNDGIKLRVATYNVGRFNHGNTSASGYTVDDFDNGIFNFKKALMTIGADFLATQEDLEYCDRAESKLTQNYLYNPIYPNYAKTSDTAKKCIYAKMAVSDSGTAPINGATEATSIAYIKCLIDNKTILLISCHNSPANNIENRKEQYKNMFDWINAQTYDYCVVLGDFNLNNTDDRDATITNTIPYLCNANNFTMANGGYLGWLWTQGTSFFNNSTDNILVSDNIIINNIEVLSSIDCSDHYPLIADIILA